ncbi:hypothetical protein AVEN_112484-1 [Araneus ventricosus]|uniref:Transposon Ty3-I Gag-Pol polyprotein n=1 Tax=Araneus ventricosus TaxID=182803 RepID=A0A4Y2UYN4_ARAVE|nr:hypothetical protein AVEN_112484-1 [Araneus ventricosus]
MNKEKETFITAEGRTSSMYTTSNYSHATFSRLQVGKVPGHSIKVTDDCIPSDRHRIPVALQEEVERQIRELLRDGTHRASTATATGHPVVCVAKKMGNIRLCVDYRQLNQLQSLIFTQWEACANYYMSGRQILIILDLTKDTGKFYEPEPSTSLQPFVTHSGLYQWNMCPLGEKMLEAPSKYGQRDPFRETQEILQAYIDDVAIFPAGRSIKLIRGDVPNASEILTSL